MSKFNRTQITRITRICADKEMNNPRKSASSVSSAFKKTNKNPRTSALSASSVFHTIKNQKVSSSSIFSNMLKIKSNLRTVATIVACLAVTAIFSGCGKDDKPDHTKAPGAVVNLAATAGDAQVELAWNAPADDGGAAITGYEITTDNWANKQTKTASELTHTSAGLTNGTEYTFKVRAVNTKGAGAESEAKATPAAAVTPSAALNCYSIAADGVKYALLIENPNQSKASYTPQAGDPYLLAIMQADGSIAEYHGVVVRFTNGNPSEITLQYFDREFSAMIDAYGTITQIKGNCPFVDVGENTIVSMTIDAPWDYKQYHCNNPFPTGTYRKMFDYYNADKSIQSEARWVLSANSAQYWKIEAATQWKWKLTENRKFIWASEPYVATKKISIYRTDTKAGVCSTISSVGLVTFENGVFMYGGTAYDKR